MARTVQCLALVLLTPLVVRGEKLVLNVHVFNTANVPQAVAQGAAKLTSKVFEAAGVHLEWCHHGESAPPHAESSHKDVVVWLLPKALSKRVSRKRATAGSAFEAQPDDNRREAALFYDRIVEAANLAHSSRYAILGYLMAHEIGHVLLGANSHEPFGLMRGTWEISDFRSAEKGDLFFFDAQALKIRAEVARRMSNASLCLFLPQP